MQGDAELHRDAGLQIAPPPAHQPVLFGIGTGLDPTGKRRHLSGRQPSGALRNPPLHQPTQTLGVVAVHPFGGETVPRKVP